MKAKKLVWEINIGCKNNPIYNSSKYTWGYYSSLINPSYLVNELVWNRLKFIEQIK